MVLGRVFSLHSRLKRSIFGQIQRYRNHLLVFPPFTFGAVRSLKTAFSVRSVVNLTVLEMHIIWHNWTEHVSDIFQGCKFCFVPNYDSESIYST